MQIKEKLVRKFLSKKIQQLNNIVADLDSLVTEIGSDYFRVPSEFQLTYMYMDKQNGYIPKISRCVLKNMEVDQSPEGVFTTFSADDRGAFPTLTKLTMTFAETEVMTKQKITEGF